MSGVTLIAQDPVVLRRRLCRHLVALRGDRTQQSVARALDWSRSKVIRIETGTIGVSTADLRALLAHFQVSNPAMVEMLVHMAKESRHTIVNPYSDVLSPELVYYLRFEASASRIRQFQPYFVPGLLQTEEYATAVIHALADEGTEPAILQRQVEARMARAATLTDGRRVRAQFVIDESALRRPVDATGGDDLMRRQLDHLAGLNEDPHVEVRVLPLGAGLRRGGQWPFVLLDFPGEEGDTLLYLEGRDTRVTRDDADEVARHRATFDALAAAAVDVEVFLRTF